MSTDRIETHDALIAALEMARSHTERSGFVGYGVAELFDGDGQSKLIVPFANLITDQGDLWLAGKAIASIAPASPAAPTALTGMQIGSGSTAVAKAGAGGAMVTLLAGVAFDATYPQTANLGAGLGVNAVFKTTFVAGTGTGTVNEATMTHGTIGASSTAGNTIARVLTGAITKGASDSLALTWNVKQLGT